MKLHAFLLLMPLLILSCKKKEDPSSALETEKEKWQESLKKYDGTNGREEGVLPPLNEKESSVNKIRPGNEPPMGEGMDDL